MYTQTKRFNIQIQQHRTCGIWGVYFICYYQLYQFLFFIIFQQNDTTFDTKIVTLKCLPLLLSSLGSFSFHLITEFLPGLLSCGEAVQHEIAKVIGSLACVLTENTVIRKLKDELSFDDPVCSSITFLCPDCDRNVSNKAGNMYVGYINNNCHLARKYARIFVSGHYLFREANSFPRAKLEENCELQIFFSQRLLVRESWSSC